MTDSQIVKTLLSAWGGPLIALMLFVAAIIGSANGEGGAGVLLLCVGGLGWLVAASFAKRLMNATDATPLKEGRVFNSDEKDAGTA